MRPNNIILGILLVLFILVACGTKKNSQTLVTKERSTEELLTILKNDHDNKLESLQTKIATKFKSKKYNYSFKTSVKLRRDSLLWFRISFAGIPIYDGWVDKDSITVLDKTKKEYWIEDYKFLSSFVATQVTYDNFEELALGLPIEFDTTREYLQVKDKNFYVVSTHSKKDIDKFYKGKYDTDDLIMRYYIDPDSLRMQKIILDVPQDTATITISYPEFFYLDGNRIPKTSELYITTPSDTILLELKYLKSRVNEPVEFDIEIPDKYEEIE
ncbi:MAG: DUF4292 domain-containing protein [Crocinitomicaceae bacterium]|nr:DUF4292 domain-containing protein [Crocinitomicaceae bacterium]